MSTFKKNKKSFDEKIYNALKELKKIMKNDQFGELEKIVKYTRKNPELAGYAYIYMNKKIRDLKQAEAMFKNEQNKYLSEINKLDNKKNRLEAEILSKQKTIDDEAKKVVDQIYLLSQLLDEINVSKNKLKIKEANLASREKSLKTKENELNKLNKTLKQKETNLKKLQKNIYQDKELNKILKESQEIRNRNVNNSITSMYIWVKDTISTFDREISNATLPNGIKYLISKKEKDHLKKGLRDSLDDFPDKVYIRLVNGNAVKIPSPATYTRYNNNGTIHFKKTIYWKGTLEVITNEEIKVFSAKLYNKNQILDSLPNKLIKYDEKISLPLDLVIGLINGKDEVQGYKISSWGENTITWNMGIITAPKSWYKELKFIINKSGIKGLIKDNWIDEDIATLIQKNFEAKKQKYEKLAQEPFIFLAKELENIIDKSWKGKASDLFNLLSTKNVVPNPRKLGILLKKGSKEGLPPGWIIKNIRIGKNRQQGYIIKRI